MKLHSRWLKIMMLLATGKSTLTDSLVAAAGIIAMENVSVSLDPLCTWLLHGGRKEVQCRLGCYTIELLIRQSINARQR